MAVCHAQLKLNRQFAHRLLRWWWHCSCSRLQAGEHSVLQAGSDVCQHPFCLCWLSCLQLSHQHLCQL